METIAYGAATAAPGGEKFFANPVRGIFAVVEAFGERSDQLAAAIVEVISRIDPEEERYFSLLQAGVKPVLQEYAGKSAVSFALVTQAHKQKVRWLRAGASGISLVHSSCFVPVVAAQVVNPRALIGEEVALPGTALGLATEEIWAQGFLTLKPGEILALHSASLPVLAPGLRESVAAVLGDRLPGATLQPAVEALVAAKWRAAEGPQKGATLVLLEQAENHR